MIYLDTSAAAKLFVLEPESTVLREFVDGERDIFSSVLLEVELGRLLRRVRRDPLEARGFLDSINLVAISRSVIARAAAFAGDLKSLDAIHLATALELHHPLFPADVVTYDAGLAQAVRAAGLRVIAPGAAGSS